MAASAEALSFVVALSTVRPLCRTTLPDGRFVVNPASRRGVRATFRFFPMIVTFTCSGLKRTPGLSFSASCTWTKLLIATRKIEFPSGLTLSISRPTILSLFAINAVSSSLLPAMASRDRAKMKNVKRIKIDDFCFIMTPFSDEFILRSFENDFKDPVAARRERDLRLGGGRSLTALHSRRYSSSVVKKDIIKKGNSLRRGKREFLY